MVPLLAIISWVNAVAICLYAKNTDSVVCDSNENHTIRCNITESAVLSEAKFSVQNNGEQYVLVFRGKNQYQTTRHIVS